MMPIISPIWFYLIHLSSSLSGIGYGIITFAATAAIILGIVGLINYDEYGSDDRTYLICAKWFKKCLVATAISVLCIILPPCKETCYQMIAASVVTPDNLKAVGTTAENITNYIIESVDKLLEENSQEGDTE